MNIKRINKVLIYTLLVFSVFTFAVYPKSHSKYIKEDEYALIYRVNIHSLNQGDNSSLRLIDGTVYNKANFKMTFNQSDLFNSSIDEKQIYTINVDDGCTITKIITDGSKSIDGNEAKVTYNKKGNDTVTVQYSCPVDNIKTIINEKDYLKSTIKVKEKFMPENVSYAYTEASFQMSLDEYLEKYPIPEGVISLDKRVFTLPKVQTDKYNQVLTWLNEYIGVYGSDYQISILAYFKTLYTNDETIIVDQNLKGFKVEEDEDNYIYTITDNFIGYARTYENRGIIPNYLYFSTTDELLTKEAFEYYLNTYTYPGQTENITKILSYVEAKGGIFSIMIPDAEGKYKTIPGLTYSNNQVMVKSNIMDYVNIYINQLIEINIDTLFNMYSVMVNTLQIVYDFISDDTYNKIIGDSNVINSVTKNNTGNSSEVVAFNDYYVFDNVLLHIYSNGVANYVKAYELANEKNIELNVLTSEISEISTTLQLIDNYLGTSFNTELATYTDALQVSGTYGIFTTEVTDTSIKVVFNISL